MDDTRQIYGTSTVSPNRPYADPTSGPNGAQAQDRMGALNWQNGVFQLLPTQALSGTSANEVVLVQCDIGADSDFDDLVAAGFQGSDADPEIASFDNSIVFASLVTFGAETAIAMCLPVVRETATYSPNLEKLQFLELMVDPSDAGGTINVAASPLEIDTSAFDTAMESKIVTDAVLTAFGTKAILWLVVNNGASLYASLFDGVNLSTPAIVELGTATDPYKTIFSIDATEVLATDQNAASSALMLGITGQLNGQTGKQITVRLFDVSIGGTPSAPSVTITQLNTGIQDLVDLPWFDQAYDDTLNTLPMMRVSWGALLDTPAKQPSGANPPPTGGAGNGVTVFLGVPSGKITGKGNDTLFDTNSIGVTTVDFAANPVKAPPWAWLDIPASFVANNVASFPVTSAASKNGDQALFIGFSGISAELAGTGNPILTTSLFASYKLQEQTDKVVTSGTNFNFTANDATFNAAVASWILIGMVIGAPPFPTNLDPAGGGAASIEFGVSKTIDNKFTFQTNSGLTVGAGVSAGAVSLNASFKQSLETGSSFDTSLTFDQGIQLFPWINENKTGLVQKPNVGWYIFYMPIYRSIPYQLYQWDGTTALDVVITSIFIVNPDDAEGATDGMFVLEFDITNPAVTPSSSSFIIGPSALYTWKSAEAPAFPSTNQLDQANSTGNPSSLSWYGYMDPAPNGGASQLNLVTDKDFNFPSNIRGSTGPAAAYTLTDSVSNETSVTSTQEFSLDTDVSFSVFNLKAEQSFSLSTGVTVSEADVQTWAISYGGFYGPNSEDDVTDWAQVVTLDAIMFKPNGLPRQGIGVLPDALAGQKPWILGYRLLNKIPYPSTS